MWRTLLTRPVLDTRESPSLVLLVAVTAIGTMALHMFVPALPGAGADLRTDPGTIQFAITLYIIGLALGQLVYGPLSDRFGRRPVVIVALAVYLLATVAAALAIDVGMLLAARVVQAIGGCGGLVLGRAMVRDGAEPGQAARRMALLTMAMSVSPALAPAVGAWFIGWGGWRAVFVLLGSVGAVVFVAVVLALPETHRQRGGAAGADGKGGFTAMFGAYRRLLAEPAFLGWTIGGASATTAMLAFLSASPFIFVNVLHRTPQEAGFYYLGIAGGVSFGSLVASRLAGRVPLRRAARAASAMQVVALAAMLVADRTGHLSVAAVLAPMMVYGVGCGIAGPFATTGAVSVNPQAIGAAAGLYGFLQMLFGALCTAIVGAWHTESALAVSVVLLGAALIGQAAFALIRPRASAPR
jgi:DHA1 family bicyclomycin/chloramphenicol resistance-like MFS transporter